MITDEQVRLLRQRRMEGKRQQTAAAVVGMSARSARKWQCGSMPSEAKTERWWRTRADPFDGVCEEEILPLLGCEAAGRLRATTIIDWLEEKLSRPVQRLTTPHAATTIAGLADCRTGERSTGRIRRSTSSRSIHRREAQTDFTHCTPWESASAAGATATCCSIWC